MRATISFDIECSSIQKATAVREALSASIAEIEGAEAISAHVKQATFAYEVKGVDVETKEPFTEVVEAPTPVDAEQGYEGSHQVVVSVTPQ